MTALARKPAVGTLMLVGFNGDCARFEGEMDVVDRGVAGEIGCLDCAESGVFIEPDGSPWPCPTCKGTKRVLVSI